MRFRPLASSSAGNAYIVEDANTKLLIECGVSYKRLQKLTGFGTAGICGCLLSHEHHDHAKCHMELIKNGVPVYASDGTAGALECDAISPLPRNEQCEYAEFSVGTFDVLPFSTFHDAVSPVGYLIRSQSDGDKMAFATDTVNIRYRFIGLSILAVECNYAYDILDRCTKLPEKVRHRITNSHMELSRLCGWLPELDLSQCRELYLLHLSDACSSEGRFVDEVERCVPPTVKVIACPK